MSTDIKKTRGTIVEVVHEPGNGTRYVVIACRYNHRQWIASLPYFKGCLFVPEGSDIHYGYVQEKMPNVRSDIDASEIAKAVAMAVPKCQAIGCTDEHGSREAGVRE